MSPEKLGAFIEYVCRPLLEDIRVIIEKVEELRLPIDGEVLEMIAKKMIAIHLLTEVIKGITAVSIGYMVCQAAIRILS